MERRNMKREIIVIKEPFLYKPARVAKILDISVKQVFNLIGEDSLKAHNDAPGKIKPKGYLVVFSSLKKYRPNLFQPVFVLRPSSYRGFESLLVHQVIQ